MPDEPTKSDAAPAVSDPVGSAAVGIGWGIGKAAAALGGDNGLRMLALAFVASVTWVASWAITRYTEMQSQTDALTIRVGEERIEREKADQARRDRELRDWMTNEQEKTRANFSQNISFITKEFAQESERNRAMVFKLAGAGKVANPGEMPE